MAIEIPATRPSAWRTACLRRCARPRCPITFSITTGNYDDGHKFAVVVIDVDGDIHAFTILEAVALATIIDNAAEVPGSARS